MDESYVPRPIGPFISPDYVSEQITLGDFAAATVVWGISLIVGGFCAWQAWEQTKYARSPLRSVYIWMIWLELVVSICMGVQCWLFLLRVLHPSFAFFFTILFWWTIQVQLLLQIIINRIRVISLSDKNAKKVMIGTAVLVTMINVSVFNIWIPARMQVSERYIFLNEIWDRIEKCIYLIIDALLNAYFIKKVRNNLIANGLEKYNKLLSFNIRIIFVSLLMDVMIIAAMSIPNSFLYIQFHPLAYLVKLSIEMTMARLIRKIAISAARRGGNTRMNARQEFNYGSSSGDGTSGTVVELTSHNNPEGLTKLGGIKKTKEITIRCGPNHDEKNTDVEVVSNSSDGDGSSLRRDAVDTDDERPIRYDTWNDPRNFPGLSSTQNLC